MAIWGRGAQRWREQKRSCVWMAVAVATLLLTAVWCGSAAASPAGGRLVVAVSGLPAAQHPAVVVRGPGIVRGLRSDRLVLAGLRPGRYVVTVSSLEIAYSWRSVRAGARVFPRRGRIVVEVRRGHTSEVNAAYGTIVNPGVRKLPVGLLSVVGDPSDPTKLVYAARALVPTVGTLVVAGPTSRLPYGLIARITASRRIGGRQTLSIVNLPVSAAVPEFSFSGAINLQPVGGSPAIARAASSGNACATEATKLIDIGVSLDQFQVRQASASLYPSPHMTVEIAVRTTEHFGVNALTGGFSCPDWTILTTPQLHAAIPTPLVPIPIYADLELHGDASVTAGLSAFQINLASTHNMTLNLGSSNSFDEQEEGWNVWTSGASPQWGGQFGAMVVANFGIGVSGEGDFQLSAGLGAEAKWDSGQGCELDFKPGTLDASIDVLGFDKSTTVWRAPMRPLWKGCGSGGGTGSGGATNGGGGGGTGIVRMSSTDDQNSPVGEPVSLQMHVTDTAPGTLIYSETGLPPGLSIDAITGLITGTPTSVGSYSPSVLVQDSTGLSAQQQFRWTISNPDTMSLGAPSNQSTSVGWATDLRIQASDSGGAPITYSALGLPTGLSLNTTTGEITGAASAAGQANVTLTATDTTGAAAHVTFTWTVGTYPGTTPDPGPPWTLPLSSTSSPNSLVGMPSGDLIVPGCSSVTPTGAIAWAVPGTTPAYGCQTAIGDDQGNTYVLTDNSSGTPVVESLDAAGNVRWTNTTQGLSAWGYEAALGADGSVFFSVGDGPTTKVLGFNTQTGAPTFDQAFDDVLGIYTYSGGVAVVTLDNPYFEVAYLSYAGDVLHTYDTTQAVENVGGFSAAGGANGTVYVGGYQTCGGTDNASVEEITPSGIAWTWTDPTADSCRSEMLAATPDGGVILSRGGNNTGTLDITSIGSTGAERWDKSPAGPLGPGLFAPGDTPEAPLVDANGTVLLSYDYEATCADGTTNTCSGFEVDFVSQQTGQQVLPPERWADSTDTGTYGSWGDLGLAIGVGTLYVERTANSQATVSANGVSGLAIPYQVALQEHVEPSG